MKETKRAPSLDQAEGGILSISTQRCCTKAKLIRDALSPVMSLIRSFPPEILAAIFAARAQVASDLNAISHVSRWWRDAAIGASELWLNMKIEDYDTNHLEVVLQHFRRSQGRPISLEILFTSEEPPATPPQLLAFFEVAVKPNLQRCWSLTVHATRPVWDALSVVCGEEAYPLLRVLDVMAPQSFVDWNSLANLEDELTFTLPPNHPLEELSVHAMGVGEVHLPCIRVLRAGGRLRRLLGPDERINRWLVNGPQLLELRSFTIPSMHFQTEDEQSLPASSVQHLKLSWMYASRRADGGQNDCAPFFDALQTPSIHTLELESFQGRVWEDFLFALNTPTRKYPELTTLRLKAMNLRDLPYVGVSFFLCCFPELEVVTLDGCPVSTWESVVDVLVLHPDLCPSVTVVEVNDVMLNRQEPLPFASACLLEERMPTRFHGWGRRLV
jgi:hypothetical protein